VFPSLIQQLIEPAAISGKLFRGDLPDRYIGPDSLKSKGKSSPFHVIYRTLGLTKDVSGESHGGSK
jgi:hypothetical protein